MSHFLLLFFILLISSPFSISFPFNTSLRIDCGSLKDWTDPFNGTWLPDRYFTGGTTAVVSEPLRFRRDPEKTLRNFPLSYGKKNCYVIPLPFGRYYIRTFTVYDNYDGKSRSPSFDASVEGTVVFSWRSPWVEDLSRDGSYSDLFAFIDDGELDLCFYSMATDPPLIGSLEIKQIDPHSYASDLTGNDVVLVNYGRLSCGSVEWGPGFSNDTDDFWRSWESDEGYRAPNSESVLQSITTSEAVRGVNQPPNYFPMKLYQTAVTAETTSKEVEYELSVDAKVDYLLWFHFAEIDSSVKKEGVRVFDVVVNGNNVSRVDIYKEVGSFTAYCFNHTVKNLTTTPLTVKLLPVVGSPLISGLENYAIVSADLSTVPEQVLAMKEMKNSLRVPDRMGWNGDPCAPTSWDAWEGITCHPNKDRTGLVIFQIDLGSQALKGYISDKISLLSDLVSLNLSSNSLSGTLPSGLAQKSLVRLDLSNNQFTGPIPQSLSSSTLQLVLLNGNLLEGRVPEELYSVGVHGGAIDLSGNKGLCGVPSLPSCPMFWGKDGLSPGLKVVIALSCIVTFCLLLLVVYLCCIKRDKNDYDFGLPQDLMALSAKRNRYQRQKSLMVLEMESQHAKASQTLPLNSY